LQLAYIGKFFLWENGYFLSADIVFDNLGFYILWGVTYAVPCFYTLTSVYLANRFIELNMRLSLIFLLQGLIAIYINYEADIQKIYAKSNPSGKIWGEPIKTFTLKQRCADIDGKILESKYCLSGWWQYARNIHYVPELLTCLLWSLPAGIPNDIFGLIPYFYFVYLSILLVHRIYRLEDSCLTKYGDSYLEYKKMVPYRLIPYIY
jgi:7-dehydrocholesterol reductase